MATQDPHDAHDMPATSAGPATDPVCGMQVDPATAAGTSEYGGTTYYFCSMGCKQRFDKDPASYIGG